MPHIRKQQRGSLPIKMMQS